MHNILTNQNKPENIMKLAAQRQLYKEAKKYFILQLIITVPGTILLSLLKAIPLGTLTPIIVNIAAVFGGVIAITDLLVGHFVVAKKRSQAAKVQEEFDCNVYEMDWNKITAGRKLNKEVIMEYAAKYKPIANSPLENWYPEEIKEFSKEDAIYTCQKTNIQYDSSLRKEFLKTVYITSATVFVIIFFTSLIADMTLRNFVVQVIFPFLPILVITIKIAIEHNKSIKNLSDLHSTITGITKGNLLLTPIQLRELQNEIYCSRKTSMLIPDFFYNRKRKKLENKMHIDAAIQ